MTFLRDDEFTGVHATSGVVPDGYTVAQLAQADFEIQEIRYFVVREKIKPTDPSSAIQRYVQRKDWTYAHSTRQSAEAMLKDVLQIRAECRRVASSGPANRSEVDRAKQLLFGFRGKG